MGVEDGWRVLGITWQQGKRSIKREYRKLNGTYLPIKGGGGEGVRRNITESWRGGDQINCIVTTDDDE